MDLPEGAIRLGLTHLQDAEFLYEASLFPELVYTFKHALTQEVAYGSLLHGQRRTLHARIVEAIEALYADRLVEQVERLAYHALRGEVWAKALAYCRQAGKKPWHGQPIAKPWDISQALSALPQLPETRGHAEWPSISGSLCTMCSLCLATWGVASCIFVRPRPSRRPAMIIVGWDRSLCSCHSISSSWRV